MIIRTARISYALDSIQAESAKFLINENRLKWDLRPSNEIKSNILNIKKVKTPHSKRYHPTAVSLDLNAAPKVVAGINQSATSDNQNEP